MHEMVNYQQFDRWLASPLGQYICNLQVDWLAKQLTYTKPGAEIILLGAGNALINKLAALGLNNKLNFHSINEHPGTQGSILANYQALPIDSESCDSVIMLHVTDNYLASIEALREAYRVLKPEGTLYLSSFNKLSLWGLYKFFAKLCSPVPWRCRFSTFLELEDWLGELGFDIISSKSVGYCLPFNFKKLIALQAVVAKITPMLALPFGAINLLAVRKRVIPLTLNAHLVVSKVVNEFGVNG